MKFLVTLERDEDGIWIAECPSMPGCISQGATKDDAATNIHEAILGCLEVRAEQGMPLTVETRLVEVAVACSAMASTPKSEVESCHRAFGTTEALRTTEGTEL